MITSKENEFVKHIRSLQQKKYRDMYNEYIVSGVKLVKEAITEGMSISKIVICKDLLSETNIDVDFNKYEIEYFDKRIFEYVSDTETPQGIMAIIKFKADYQNVAGFINCNEKANPDIIFALDDVRDPGNMGTIIRTLDCAGINHIILSKNSVSVYSPKVVRSTMGAIYRVKIKEDSNLKEDLNALKELGYKVVVSTIDANVYYYALNFNEKLVIIIGNESKGVNNELQSISDYKVKIPMTGRTESLNAGVAASLIAYEYVRSKTYLG